MLEQGSKKPEMAAAFQLCNCDVAVVERTTADPEQPIRSNLPLGAHPVVVNTKGSGLNVGIFGGEKMESSGGIQGLTADPISGHGGRAIAWIGGCWMLVEALAGHLSQRRLVKVSRWIHHMGIDAE